MKKHQRKYWTSKLYRQIKVGDDTVFVPVVDDLDNEQLKWHYRRSIDDEDFEYSAAYNVELQTRGIVYFYHKTFQ